MNTNHETLARALDWVNKRLRESPPMDKMKAIDEASIRFDLSPVDQEWLIRRLMKDKNDPT
jgi:hypothetical protein